MGKHNIEHQYLNLLRDILDNGTIKPAARQGMPYTKSLFGYQMKHDLSLGFPLLTTKKMSFKTIVVELLWFLKGDTNIKFLVDNGCNIWNEDAYAYYFKKCMGQAITAPMGFDSFVYDIKNGNLEHTDLVGVYKLGDCGFQYGKVWRDWEGDISVDGNRFVLDVTNDNMQFYHTGMVENIYNESIKKRTKIDQIKNVLYSLKNTPESRRHIVTAVDPAHDQDLALYWCHSMFQFNCRPIPWETKLQLAMKNSSVEMENLHITEAASGSKEFGVVPQYYLDCHLYQRSADTLLGVPYNIASYSLLTILFAKILNMEAGEFIHSFGDVHLYENHFEVAKEQLERQPLSLPKLNINTEFWGTENGSCGEGPISIEGFLKGLQDDNFIKCLFEDIQFSDYNSHPKLKNETKY